MDGKTVRWGQLYRSDSLGKLTPAGADWERFLQLGIRTVVDLRYPWEINGRGRVPDHDGLTYYNLSIEHRPYDQAGLGDDVEPVTFLAERFAEVAQDGVVELRSVLRVIGDDQAGPVVFHCASGKDRTGIVAALVLILLGVSEADVVADFALTGLATERLVADWVRDNPRSSRRWPGYGQAPGALMQRFLDDLSARHGSVQDFVLTELQVEPEVIAAMRAHLLAPA